MVAFIIPGMNGAPSRFKYCVKWELHTSQRPSCHLVILKILIQTIEEDKLITNDQ